jgi:hypothetical protein
MFIHFYFHYLYPPLTHLQHTPTTWFSWKQQHSEQLLELRVRRYHNLLVAWEIVQPTSKQQQQQQQPLMQQQHQQQQGHHQQHQHHQQGQGPTFFFSSSSSSSTVAMATQQQQQRSGMKRDTFFKLVDAVTAFSSKISSAAAVAAAGLGAGGADGGTSKLGYGKQKLSEGEKRAMFRFEKHHTQLTHTRTHT